jgi:hypothetical protein
MNGLLPARNHHQTCFNQPGFTMAKHSWFRSFYLRCCPLAGSSHRGKKLKLKQEAHIVATTPLEARAYIEARSTHTVIHSVSIEYVSSSITLQMFPELCAGQWASFSGPTPNLAPIIYLGRCTVARCSCSDHATLYIRYMIGIGTDIV